MNIIEKLEELHKSLSAVSRTNTKEIDDLCAIIEEYKKQEPFGYFKAEPFGWTDCAKTDEGAIALYETPPLSDEAVKDAARWKAILHSQAYSPSDFGNPIGFAGRLGQYESEALNKSVDKYIEKYMIDEAMKADNA